MEKRSSGGGAKLGTLDMQSYLEVMGRQLDEIQAQHQQFYASRGDRLCKLRSQEHSGHLVKGWSSESHGIPQLGALPGECQAPYGGSHAYGQQGQQGSPCNDDNSSGALRSSGNSQGGARRSLLFADGLGEGGRGVKPTAVAGPAPGEGPPAATARTMEVPQRALAKMQGSIGSPSISESSSMTQSITPTVSSQLRSDTPGTPSTRNGPRAGTPMGAAQLGTASSSRTSLMGPYAVYIASGVASVPYATPDSRGGSCPLTASISSSSQDGWRSSPDAMPGPSPSPGPSALQGAAAPPATASTGSSPLTVRGPDASTANAAVTDDDVSPYTFALAGRSFDGIDSEEESDAQTSDARHASCSGHCVRDDAEPSGLRSGTSAEHVRQESQPVGDGGEQVSRRAGPATSACGSDAAPLPHSRPERRTALVAASLETEEALRTLFATPRLGSGRSGTIGASVDAEGLEVPDEVLAALAKTDGMDLDAALDAAMGLSLREAAGQEQAGTHQPGASGLALAGHGRHMVVRPGALTAAPLAVPAAVTAHGYDASMRRVGGACGRTSGTGGGASPVLQPPPAPAYRSASHISASIEPDRLDALSQTLEVSAVSADLSAFELRDSVACAAMAMAAQVAAAQQHFQPVLYSLAPKSSVPLDKSRRRTTVDGEGRRSTFDGGSNRNTLDGSSRRNTVDGGGALKEYAEDSPSRARPPSLPAPAAAVVPTGPIAGAPSKLRPVNASPGAGIIAAEHCAALSPAGQLSVEAPEAFTADATPARAFHSGTSAASPSAASSAARPGGDGDMVLYGSPSNKLDAVASPRVACSPYVPPSPPPGADPSPYMTSPTVPLLGSRLQRNSRVLDEETITAVQRDAGSERGSAGQEDTAGAMGGLEAGLRPWSAVMGAHSSSRRYVSQPAASGSSSGANSVHLDLSLTQAAAAAATNGGRTPAVGAHQPSTTPTSGVSPALIQRQPRAQGPQHLPVLPKQLPDQQPGPLFLEAPQQPALSPFSLAGLSPARATAKVISHDLGVDEGGRSLQHLPAAKDATCGAPSIQAEPDAEVPGRGRRRITKRQLQPGLGGPQLAAFSRAAALAAAADMGMEAPPPALERHAALPAPTTGEVGATPAGAGLAGADPHARGKHAPGGAETFKTTRVGHGASLPHGQPRLAGAASVHEDSTADARDVLLEHLELQQGQSPGPISAASSAAKLSQLKARRQQQWQSQHGLQGNPQLSAGPATPHSPQASSRHQEEQPADAVAGHRSLLPGSSGLGHNGSSGACGSATRSSMHPVSGSAGGGATPGSAFRSPLSAAIGSPLLPDAVAEAIARAASAKADPTISGELNLGHGISGLSVAIEAGQVKWAWQTDATGKRDPGQLESTPDAPPSPGGRGNGSSSPWASPRAVQGAFGESSTEWALKQLPVPQWQGHGLPAGSFVHKQEGQGQRADDRPPIPQSRQPGGQYADSRWRSEYYPADRQLSGAGAPKLNYAVSAGGFLTHEQHQPRVPSATDGGGQPSSKAMALLRLKQQSILRHNVSISGPKESIVQPESAQHQAQPGSAFPQPMQGRASSAGPHPEGQQQPLELQQQRLVPAPRAPLPSELVEPRQPVSRPWTQSGGNEDAAGHQGAGSGAQPKPFLRRRSAKVQPKKVDWSHVKPRTNSRNPDYYVDQISPDVIKARVSPLTSPKGGVAKPPLNLNMGVRGKKAAGKPPLTPTGDEKAPAGGQVKRRMSNIPPAPGPGRAAGGAAEDQRAGGVGGSRGASGSLSPLDDLLAHVNTLLRDFDKIVL